MIERFWESLKKDKATQIATAISAALLVAVLFLVAILATGLKGVKKGGHEKAAAVLSAKNQIGQAAKYYNKGNFKKAIEGFREAVSQEPSNAEVYFMLGNAYQGTGAWKEAASSYEKAADLDERMVKAKYQLGLAYKKLGDNKSAAEYLEECVRQAPDLGGARLALAKIYTDDNKLDKAIEQYTALLDMNLYGMNLASIHNDLGLVYVKKGNLEQARSEWQKALMVQPENTQARGLLAEYR